MIFDKVIKNNNEVLDLLLSYKDNYNNLLITYFNQHCFNIYRTNINYKKIIEDNFHIYLDGFGIYFALKIFNYKKVKKFNASDLNEEIIKYLSTQKKKIFIVGGNFADSQICAGVKNGMNICGYQKGYFAKHEVNEILNKIAVMNPDVIFVAMGIPKQEFFALELAEKLKGKIIICAGNYFEFYFGNIKRIPKRMKKFRIRVAF